MPLWIGETWLCICGFVNAILRVRCRNCGKFRIEGEVKGETDHANDYRNGRLAEELAAFGA